MQVRILWCTPVGALTFSYQADKLILPFALPATVGSATSSFSGALASHRRRNSAFCRFCWSSSACSSSICSFARELARLTKNHNNRPTSSSATDTASDARFKIQDLVTHSFHHLKEKAFIYHPRRRRKSVGRKMSYHGINLLIVQMPLKNWTSCRTLR